MNARLDMPSFLPDKNWTPREREVLGHLLDGKRHPLNDMHDMHPDLYDSERRALVAQVVKIRHKLKGTGYWIVCEFYRKRTCYRLVRLITDAE